ncbi:hypothetical protein CJJ23_03545 [Mycoplasmopsis agassizii]|uniref:DUF3899 domain-containing protein n=1 Tax=Mycoplasmopsis agassizii TaxID=33922 RepID=A0A269TI06_9BACT|nr:hypothetical protein [Mycoplasmopsis agassizii]PAK21112.1 hypothetical protein CJJ23_03545 [Mycoplasmopsis agassizii]
MNNKKLTNLPYIKKFFNKTFFFILFGLIGLEILLFIILYFSFVSASVKLDIISHIYFGIFVVLLLPSIFYYISFKAVSTKNFRQKHNREVKIKNTDKRLIDRFYINAEHNFNNYRQALIRANYWYAAVVILPIIVSLIIAIVFALI